MEKRLTTKAQYTEAKARMESLISEATAKGLLEPDMDNEYTRSIASLAAQVSDYEDEYLDVLPLREKSPLIRCIEDYFLAHNMKRKEGASYLHVTESVLSQIMNGKRHISMAFAKRLHTQMGIDADTILEFA